MLYIFAKWGFRNSVADFLFGVGSCALAGYGTYKLAGAVDNPPPQSL